VPSGQPESQVDSRIGRDQRNGPYMACKGSRLGSALPCPAGRSVPGRGGPERRRRPRPDGTGTPMLTRLLTGCAATPRDEREQHGTGLRHTSSSTAWYRPGEHRPTHLAGNLGPGGATRGGSNPPLARPPDQVLRASPPLACLGSDDRLSTPCQRDAPALWSPSPRISLATGPAACLSRPGSTWL
jgi:hypothetical protein